MNDQKNSNIGCTVVSCKYHCDNANYCSLNAIEVGACNCDPKSVDGTCCQSFEAKAY